MDDSLIRYHDISCKSAFRKLKKHKGPYEYDMNIYRGCAHQCAYCFAIYSQKYLEHTDFYHDVYIKENIVEQLQIQLSSPSWKKKIIAIGTVCDAYQPIEKDRKIMPDILRLLIRYQTPCIISTKSDLILRDMELLRHLSQITYVNIATTITTMEEKIASIVEAGAVSPQRRVHTLKEIKEHTNASIGLHNMPMLPYISDDDASLRQIFQVAKDINVDYIINVPLNLIGDSKQMYFNMLGKHFPHLVQPYKRLFHGGYVDKVYQKDIYKIIASLSKEYGISRDYMKKVRDHFHKSEVEQLSLW